MELASLFAIILLEGFVTISVEILAIRQLMPFVGNNVIVTSLIIGLFLLFLALGYLRGGRYTEQFHTVLKTNFIKATVLIGFGLSYLFVTLFFQTSRLYLTHSSLIILAAYLFLIIAPTVYILGQTVPITTNLFRRDQRIGEVSGKVLYLSTLGSFLGAVLTSLVFFNFFGVAWTVFLNALILSVLILLLSHQRPQFISTTFFLLGALAFIYMMNISVEHIHFLKTNNYANYKVVHDYPIRPGRYGDALIINNSLSSFLDNQKKAAPYIEKLKQILQRDLQLQHKKILVLGAGGFTLTANGLGNNQVTYVDIDKDIQAVVKKHFQSRIQGQFVAADARSYIPNHKQSFDVIISDVFKSRIAIPAYLLTKEYLVQLRAAIKPDGFALFNLILNPLLTDPYSKHVDNSITAVFHNCMKLPMDYRNQFQNVLYLCHVGQAENDKYSYTDNKNRATLDFFHAMQ